MTSTINAIITSMNITIGLLNMTTTVMNTATGVLNGTATVMSTASRDLNATATVIDTSVMSVICQSVPYLENGRVTEIRTFKYNSTAEFQCNTGFYLKGDAKITCLGNNTWSDPRPSCSPDFFGISNHNDIHIQLGDTPAPYPWLTIVLAVFAGLLGILILSCTLCCCLRMCGCFHGTELRVFPRGNLHLEEEVERGEYSNRHTSRAGNQYSDPKSGHRNINHSTIHTSEETSESSTPTCNKNGSKTKERNNLRKNAKVSNAWMPHTHPIRNINTSTR